MYGYIAQELCEYTLEEYMQYIVQKKKTLTMDSTLAYRLAWQVVKALQVNPYTTHLSLRREAQTA